jgi:hypothetical protein
MDRLRSALCNPYHVALLLLVAWLGTPLLIADALGIIDPDYKVLIFGVVFIYWLLVLVEVFRKGK